MPHPDEGLIHAWLDGELDETDAARVEALVASDPGWAAGAAEARGLIAASARIAGALDRVPANVIPAPVPARHRSRQWAWRAAAAIVLLTGSAVVLERREPALPVRAAQDDAKSAPASPLARTPVPVPATGVPAPAAKPGVAMQSNVPRKELALQKQAGVGGAADSVSAQARVRADAAGAAAVASVPPASVPAAAPSARALRAFAGRATAPQVQCFEQRQRADSAKRIITLDAREIADSVRLGTLTIHGDTLAAVNGGLRAIRVQCPER